MSDHSRSTPRSGLFPCTGRAILLLLGIWIVPTLSLAALSLDPAHVWFGTDQVRLLTAAERVLDGEPALVGAYSREGVHHPGPFYTYLLAAVHGVTGREPTLTQAVMGVAQGSAPLLLAILCLRISGSLWLSAWLPWICLVGWPVTIFGRMIWNPSLMPSLTALTLWMTVEVVHGSRWALPVAIAAASALAQIHLAALPVAMALAIVAITWCLVDDLRRPLPSRSWRRALVSSVVIASILWLPVLVDAVQHRGGNVRGIWALTARTTSELSVTAAWAPVHAVLSATFPAPAGQAMLAVALTGALFAVTAVILRRRCPHLLRYLVLVAVAWLALLLALARSPARIETYYLGFVDVLAGATLIGAIAGLVLLTHARARHTLLGAATLLGLLILAPRVLTEVVQARDVEWNAFPLADFQRLAWAVRSETRHRIDLGSRPVAGRLEGLADGAPLVRRTVSFPAADDFALREPLQYVLRRSGVEMRDEPEGVRYRVRRVETAASRDGATEIGHTPRFVLEILSSTTAVTERAHRERPTDAPASARHPA